ncbi:hemopexin repeat-containing protein [Streptomyces sp. NPDC059564]|uniref:hemopexin repeat-containing protein n=1 Tax=Streptomyces sp. NPDC059564 TaxID=3346865 RepID=UPI0036C095F7
MGSDDTYYYALIETTEGEKLYVRFSQSGDKLDTGFTQPFEQAWKGSREAVDWLAAAAASGASLPSPYLPKTGKVYFMRGDAYVRCTMATHTIDDGYPKTITSYWTGLQEARFGTGNSAALAWDDDGKRLYLFNRDQYVRYDLEADKVDDGYPKTIGGYWAGTQEAGFSTGIDAFIRWDADTAYAFKGGQYIRYNITKDKVDPGYPRGITDHWSALAQARTRRVLALWKAPATKVNAVRIRPVVEAGTSTPAFITPDDGAERLLLDEPRKVNSWKEFEQQWKVPALVAECGQKPESEYTPELTADLVMAEAVYAFFAHGGRSCYIVPRAKGDHDYAKALTALERVHDVHMVVAPTLRLDKPGPADARLVMRSIAAHCQKMRNRVAILDTPRPSDPSTAGAQGLDAEPPLQSAYAAVYTPWVKVAGLDDRPRLVPAGGHIAGLWARTDKERGVHKAPEGELSGVLDLAEQLTEKQATALNHRGVNCVRTFPGRGVTVWGNRTLSAENDHMYLNVRRLTCFLTDTIEQSTRWAVFEPNDEKLWAGIHTQVTGFLTDQWRKGALQGATAESAFRVICDESNNQRSGSDKGVVRVDVAIAPVRPGEFVSMTIKQYR